MQITRKSPITGKVNTKNIPVTKEQMDNWIAGELIQKAMPNLTADEREFIKTGITAEEWEEMFGRDGE